MYGRWLASRWIRALFVALVLLMGLSGVASAFEELIPTKVGVVKFGGSPPEGKLFKVVSKAPNPPLFALPTSSPVATGGSLTVTMGSGALSCTLSAGAFDGTVGWRELGNPPGSKGYRYKNKGAPGSDPCRAVTLTEKAIKVIAKATDTLPVPLASGNPDVFVSLRLGGDRYCGEWTGPYLKEKEDKLVKAKDEPPPSACPCGLNFPVCNGACSSGETCQPSAYRCVGGTGSGSPCDPDAPNCPFQGLCLPSACACGLPPPTPCGDSAAPECGGACPSGQFCLSDAYGGACNCRTDAQCTAGGLCSLGLCGACPPPYSCFEPSPGDVYCLRFGCDSDCSCPLGGTCFY